jgi:hypothetical protein
VLAWLAIVAAVVIAVLPIYLLRGIGHPQSSDEAAVIGDFAWSFWRWSVLLILPAWLFFIAGKIADGIHTTARHAVIHSQILAEVRAATAATATAAQACADVLAAHRERQAEQFANVLGLMRAADELEPEASGAGSPPRHPEA